MGDKNKQCYFLILFFFVDVKLFSYRAKPKQSKMGISAVVNDKITCRTLRNSSSARFAFCVVENREIEFGES